MNQLLFTVEARQYGHTQGLALFETKEEADAFAEECRAFEETRYPEPVHPDQYMQVREAFDRAHPWKRFSRGVRYQVGAIPVGRPQKSEARK